MNQHTVGVTIIWPDSFWDQAVEQAYLVDCLDGVKEHFESVPPQNKEERRTLTNRFGRVYAEIHINPVKGG